MRALIAIFISILLQSCTPTAKPALYGAGLEECNRTAKTCEESIACENKLRAAAHRPLREQDGCK